MPGEASNRARGPVGWIAFINILAITVAVCFSLGYGLAARNLPEALVLHSLENNVTAWEYYQNGQEEQARISISFSAELCRLYNDVYRTEDLFNGRERDLHVKTCNEIIESRNRIFLETLDPDEFWNFTGEEYAINWSPILDSQPEG